MERYSCLVYLERGQVLPTDTWHLLVPIVQFSNDDTFVRLCLPHSVRYERLENFCEAC